MSQTVDLQSLVARLLDPEGRLDPAGLMAVAREWPFFTLPAVEALKRGAQDIDEATRQRLMEQIALNSPDSAALMLMISPKGREFADFYPAEDHQVTTDDAITRFLETYGHADPAEDALIERLIFNPQPLDYTTLLEQEGETPDASGKPVQKSEQDSLIDAFLASAPAEPVEIAPAVEPLHEPEPVERPTPAAVLHPQEDSSLSESLAKIYIKQRRFDKAFEIIHTLSLNNPKKSAYFADQLRFLSKLMLIKEHK